jgi:cytochrome P450
MDREVVDVDLYCPDAVRDPWPRIERLRRRGPVVWNERVQHWMVTSDRLVRKTLLDYERFSLTGVTAPFFGDAAFIAIDDRERHDALRGVWSVAFQRGTLERLEALIAEIADRMLDAVEARLRGRETVEAADAYCRDLPAYVIAHMLGASAGMRPKIVEWSDRMGAAGGVPNVDRETDPRWLSSEAAKADLAAFLFEQISHRRRHAGDDLISQIVHSEVGRDLSDEAIMQNARQLLFAGNETTAKWLGHIVVTLGARPAERAALVADPSLIPAAVEEIMRWEPVVQRIPRIVAVDAEIGGTSVLEGDQVLLLTGAANRDPERYEHPDRLDIRRAPKAHLGFGYGMHSCLGVTLARIEAKVATARLLARLPDYRLAGPVEYGAFGLRGPVTVPISL